MQQIQKENKNVIRTGVLLPHEIFELIEKESDANEKIQILKENDSFELRTILQGNFDKNIVFDLPLGTPPFTENPAPSGYNYSSVKNILVPIAYLITTGNLARRVTRIKKESIFIRMIESLHVKDAKILIAMKDKELSKLYPSITRKLVLQVWPKLF